MINNYIASIMIIISVTFYIFIVLQLYYVYTCNNCVIVHLHSPYFVAVMILLSPPSLSLSLSLSLQTMDTEFARWMDFYGKSYGEYELFKGDFMDPKFDEIISSAT